jgi:hypothetical protein
MAAPTSAVQKFQKILANAGPSTHGLLRWFWGALDAHKKISTSFARRGSKPDSPGFSRFHASHVGLGIPKLPFLGRPNQSRTRP